MNEFKAINKMPLQSKKFIAFLICNIGWLFLIGLAIWFQESFAVQMTMVIVAGFIQSAYLCGQAVVDIYAHTLIPAVVGLKSPAEKLIEKSAEKPAETPAS